MVSGPGRFVPAILVTGGDDVASVACCVVTVVVDCLGCDGGVDTGEVADGRLEQGGNGKAEDAVSCGDRSASGTVSDVMTVELRRDATACGRGIRLGRSS